MCSVGLNGHMETLSTLPYVREIHPGSVEFPSQREGDKNAESWCLLCCDPEQAVERYFVKAGFIFHLHIVRFVCFMVTDYEKEMHIY